MARVRTTYSSSEIYHAWAHDTAQTDSYKSRGVRVFVERYRADSGIEFQRIFSYGHHFPMAERLKLRDGRIVFLVNPNSYSVTTSSHQSSMRHAIPHNVPRFNLPPTEWGFVHSCIRNERGAAQQLASYYQGRINAKLAEAAKPRKRPHTVANLIGEAERIRNEWRSLHAFLKMRVKADRVSIPDLEEYRAKVAKESEKSRKRRLAAEAKARKVAEELAQQAAPLMMDWMRCLIDDLTVRDGERIVGHIPSAVGSEAARVLQHAGNHSPSGRFVETTQGVRVPLDDARKAVRIVQRLRARMESPNGSEERTAPGIEGASDTMLQSSMVSVDPERVRIGCHTFTWRWVDEFLKLNADALQL